MFTTLPTPTVSKLKNSIYLAIAARQLAKQVFLLQELSVSQMELKTEICLRIHRSTFKAKE